jgi:hypothetical protein
VAKDFDNVIAAWHLFLHGKNMFELRKIVNPPALRSDAHDHSAPQLPPSRSADEHNRYDPVGI